MCEEVGDGVDVCSFRYLQGGECMAETVECDVFGYACVFEPVLERGLGVVAFELFEYQSCSWLSAEVVGFCGKGKRSFGVGFFRFDAYAPASVLGFGDVFPSEGEDVAYAESGQAAEE